MKFRQPRLPVFAALVAMGLCHGLIDAQTKPSESTSKVKKVMLYNKIGGWVAVDGVAAVKAAFSKLSEAKNFELVQLDDDSLITLDYLKQFQAIVWNNNTNGTGSVPRAKARQAVMDYLNQGGGWMLICWAGDHGDTWPGLAETMGTKFDLDGMIDRGEVVLDSAASLHRELKWMVDGFPHVFELNDLWFSFSKTVRPLPAVTVIATARNIPGYPPVVFPTADSSGDNVYIWAREVGQGRMLYNAIGYGKNNLMAQQDSIVPRLYWENLRYVAGDYQNGCTTPSSPGFDPAARVHVEAMCSVTGMKPSPTSSKALLSKGGRRMRLAIPDGPYEIRLRDPRGALIWERSLPAGSDEIALDADLGPGIYPVEIRSATRTLQFRLALP